MISRKQSTIQLEDPKAELMKIGHVGFDEIIETRPPLHTFYTE